MLLNAKLANITLKCLSELLNNSDCYAMQYVSGVFRGIGRDLEHLRNAPHFHGIAANQAPRLPGYIAAGATALAATGVGGWILNRVATAVAYPFEIVSEGVYHNPSGYEFVVAPFRALEGPVEFTIAAAGIAGFAAGAALGARAGLAVGRRVADFWTRSFENINVVRGRVSRYFSDVVHVPTRIPYGATESPLDRRTREYIEQLYS